MKQPIHRKSPQSRSQSLLQANKRILAGDRKLHLQTYYNWLTGRSADRPTKTYAR